MKKNILMVLVFVGMCYMSLLNAAADTEKYMQLQADNISLSNKSRRLAILGEVIKDDLWDVFKEVYHEIKQAGGQGMRQDAPLKKLEDEKLLRELSEYGQVEGHGTLPSSYYEKKYVEERLLDPSNAPERQRAFELIERVNVITIDQELFALMNEAEEHGSCMLDYIVEQQRLVEHAKQAIEVELRQYTKEYFTGGGFPGYTLKRKSGIGQDANAAAGDESEQCVSDSGKRVGQHTIIRKLEKSGRIQRYDQLKLDQDATNRKISLLGIIDEIITADIWDEFKSLYQEIERTHAVSLEKESMQALREEELNRELDSHAIWSGFEGTAHHDGKYLETELLKIERAATKRGQGRNKQGCVVVARPIENESVAKRRRSLELMQKIDSCCRNRELLAMMSELEEYGPEMRNVLVKRLRQAEQVKKEIELELGQLPEPEVRFMGRRWTPEKKLGRKRNMDDEEAEKAARVEEVGQDQGQPFEEYAGHTSGRIMKAAQDKKTSDERPSKRSKPPVIGRVDRRGGMPMPEGGFTEDDPIVWRSASDDEKAEEGEPVAPSRIKFRFGEGYRPNKRRSQCRIISELADGMSEVSDLMGDSVSGYRSVQVFAHEAGTSTMLIQGEFISEETLRHLPRLRD